MGITDFQRKCVFAMKHVILSENTVFVESMASESLIFLSKKLIFQPRWAPGNIKVCKMMSRSGKHNFLVNCRFWEGDLEKMYISPIWGVHGPKVALEPMIFHWIS